MSNEEFTEKCKELVRDYAIEHLDKTDEMQNLQYMWYGVVRHCKTVLVKSYE